MKLLGIDYGTKRVGIALSDEEGRVAFPYSTLTHGKNLTAAIVEICKKENVETIIIGESRDFKGKENPIMPAVRALKTALERETGLPVRFEPEMLTTREARRAPAKQEKTRAARKRESVDASAAAIILQSYIDKNRRKYEGTRK